MGCCHSAVVEPAARKRSRRRERKSPASGSSAAEESDNFERQSEASLADDERSQRSRGDASARVASAPLELAPNARLNDLSDEFFRPRYPSETLSRHSADSTPPLVQPRHLVPNPLAESLEPGLPSLRADWGVAVDNSQNSETPTLAQPRGDGLVDSSDRRYALAAFEDDNDLRRASDLGASAATVSLDSTALALLREIEEQRPCSPSYHTREPSDVKWWQLNVERNAGLQRTLRGVETLPPAAPGARPLSEGKKVVIASWRHSVQTPERPIAVRVPTISEAERSGPSL